MQGELRKGARQLRTWKVKRDALTCSMLMHKQGSLQSLNMDKTSCNQATVNICSSIVMDLVRLAMARIDHRPDWTSVQKSVAKLDNTIRMGMRSIRAASC